MIFGDITTTGSLRGHVTKDAAFLQAAQRLMVPGGAIATPVLSLFYRIYGALDQAFR